jgi:hypothetical protein
MPAKATRFLVKTTARIFVATVVIIWAYGCTLMSMPQREQWALHKCAIIAIPANATQFLVNITALLIGATLLIPGA